MIRCDGVTFSYDGRSPALDGLTLEVADGEFLCVLGGNGSGKSTLAKHLNALLVPDGGRVLVDGIDTSDPEYVYDIRSRVGYVFQNPDDQLVATLVEDDVAFGPENLGVESREVSRRVERALAAVGLQGFGRRETSALSGGQKQRVAIAGVLAMEPDVLVLDEATSMLDPRGRAGLMDVCRRLHERGLTIIMITHYMEEAARADRVVVLRSGRVALEGSPDEVFGRVEEVRGLGLELPAPCELALALRDRGLDVGASVDEGRLVGEIARMVRASGAVPHRPGPAEAPRGVPGGAPETCMELDHVSFSYERSARVRRRRRPSPRRAAWGSAPDAVWALSDVCLSIGRGEFVGLAGHTGSGKSTLLQHMNGLEHPTEGRVRAFGEDLSDKRALERARARIGIVFQYPEHQLFAETVFDDVAFGPRNLGLAEGDVDRAVRAAIGRVGLDFELVAGKSPFSLSGGQQRRVAFAGVLAMHPEVLVLDEPAAGLDPAARRELLGLVRSLNGDGLTVVMASHSMDDLAELCDRIVVLDGGGVYLEGSPAEVFSRPEELHRVGLALPAAGRMARELASAGVPVGPVAPRSVGELADALADLMGGGR